MERVQYDMAYMFAYSMRKVEYMGMTDQSSQHLLHPLEVVLFLALT